MPALRMARFARRSLWRHDTPLVASWLMLAALQQVGAAAVPAPFSTFLLENTTVRSVGHDSAGNLYVLGVRTDGSAFVTRFAPDASRTAWSLNLAGFTCAGGTAMAVDGAGNLFIAGGTLDANGKAYPCVLKLDSAGHSVYSFVLERAAAATPQAVIVDADGSVLMTGVALEAGFPAAGGGYSAPPNANSASAVFHPFVARVNAAGTTLLAAAVGVGGPQIVIGPGGDVFVSGNIAGFGVVSDPSLSYPVTPGAFQTTFPPSFGCTAFPCQIAAPSPEQYVTRLDSGLTRLVYSTYVTGSHGAYNRSLAVDAAGNAYLTGTTTSADYPYAGPAPGARAGAFLTKLDSTGSKLVWSVQQGGDFLAFDAGGNLVVGGSAWPPAGLPYQAPANPLPALPPANGIPAACMPDGIHVQIAAFVQRLDPRDGSVLATQFLAATRVEPSGLDMLPDGRILLAGSSIFPDVPITPGAMFSSAVTQRSTRGAFLAAFDLSSPSLGAGHVSCATDAATVMPVGPVAPGQLLALFGDGLGPAQSLSASLTGPGPLPVSLGGVTVTFDGIAAPLTYVSSSQINLAVPWELTGKASTTVNVMVDGQTVATRVFAVVPSNPSLFLDTNVSPSDGNSFFPAVALNQDRSRNSAANPAAAGSMVTLFLNGAAAYPAGMPPATGSIAGLDPTPAGVPVTVMAGTATLETGPLMQWPGWLNGVYLLQVQMPPVNAPLRAVPVTVTVGGVPAAPFVYIDKVYQAGALIWVD